MSGATAWSKSLLIKFYSLSPLLWRILGLAFFESVLWLALHQILTGDELGSFSFFVVKLLSSTLIFSVFNGIFVSFNYYRYGKIAQFFISILYVLPMIQLIYFQSARNFLNQQTLSFFLREPRFLLRLVTSGGPTLFVCFLAAVVAHWVLNQKVLYRNHHTHPRKPYDFFLNPWCLGFTAIMVYLQVKWCLDQDPSQLEMRPLYPVTFMVMLSLLVFFWRARMYYAKKLFALALIVVNIGQLYVLNFYFLDEKNKFSMDQQFFRSLFGAYYIQAGFNELSQGTGAREKFVQLPTANLDYNILVVVNDAQRWDILSSNGNPDLTDESLDWFYKRSFNFQYPIAPANFTDTSMPGLLLGMGSDQDVVKLKSSLLLWDYFAKGAETFFISSQDTHWSRLNLFYSSIGQKHHWSAAHDPSSPVVDDRLDKYAFDHIKEYLPKLKKNWVGVLQTHASHFPYRVEEPFKRYAPCDTANDATTEKLKNCYLNAQVYSAHLRDDLLKSIDLENTVVVFTSDHGEGFGEHGLFSHGKGYYQEIVKVPFNLYVPPRLLKLLPKEALENITKNTRHVTSTMDLVPTLLHLHEMVSGQKLHANLKEFSGRSLFEKQENRTVFSSHCYSQYRCYSREILFTNDDYALMFRPSEKRMRIYETWRDPLQKHPLSHSELVHEKFMRLLNGAAEAHEFGQALRLSAVN